MTDKDRFKLLFGPYKAPRFKYGDVVSCEIRGDVKIVGLTTARIPWPKCRTGKRSRAIIRFGDLADAVRHESAQAVAHWFGVGLDTVWKWRKALGISHRTPGTTALRSRWAPETVQSEKAVQNLEPTFKSPERAAKIAAAKRGGEQRPKSVIEAIRKANIGKKASAETRRKMSEAHKWRGTVPPVAKGRRAEGGSTSFFPKFLAAQRRSRFSGDEDLLPRGRPVRLP